jgi:uncharacterized protein (DUF1330 family)
MSGKSAYILVDVDIHNPEIYESYKQQVVPIVTAFGGEYIARGGALDVLQDELWSPTRIVLMKFPSMAKAKAFMDSPEYAPVKQIRMENSAGTLVIIDGC